MPLESSWSEALAAWLHGNAATESGPAPPTFGAKVTIKSQKQAALAPIFTLSPSILTPEVMAAVAEGISATLVTIPTTAEMPSAAAPTTIKTEKANTKLTKITENHDKCQKNRQ
ncbi:hypothetical protein [Prevotella dentalis]|uniref:hypothetical protein n=1 Tax=Prevotella dentalis TaxID=52227 RepID=UPI00265AEBA8|nr:hypothetical protein [Prevotella dentalis]MCF2637244.1 hypothetical protein [Prevotella dentalis]